MKIKKYTSTSSVEHNHKSFAKFATVGLLGTIVNLLCMAVLVEFFSFEHITASLIAVEISIIHNFLLNSLWTFSSRQPTGSTVKLFLSFNMISIGSLVVNVGVASILIQQGVAYLVAQASGIFSAFFINYLINNHMIFKDQRINDKSEMFYE